MDAEQRRAGALKELRALLPEVAEQAFTRAAGAPRLTGNEVRLLIDAEQNYPAWLAAIARAQRTILFENYIIRDDAIGRQFSDALIARAGDGVQVCLLHDWMGARGRTPRAFWQRLQTNGVQVRCFNPPRFDSPFGWFSRDHRKTLSVDGEIGFVSGLCVAEMWVGDPKRGIAPWRDTGVQVRGPAVAEIERAFAQVWAMTGEPLPETQLPEMQLSRGQTPAFGADMAVRVVASVPNTAALMRLDLIVAALARERLWLTDAYYAGTTAYVQSLRAAARDGVDVRLLVPNATDIPVLQPLSRTGYRPLLEAGVRVFEWNGTMLHAKTAVADSYFTRIGSSNLNVASWIGNCELDLVVEDEKFAEQMARQYERDLANATEIVLDEHDRMRVPPTASAPSDMVAGASGSSGRAVAGALRIGNAVGAAFTNRRVLEPVEGRIMTVAGIVLLTLALLGLLLPYVLVMPLALLAVWIGCALLVRGWRLKQQRRATARALT